MSVGWTSCVRRGRPACLPAPPPYLSDGGADGEEPEVEVDGGVLHDEAHERPQLARVHQRDEGEDGGEGVQVEHHDHRGDLMMIQ